MASEERAEKRQAQLDAKEKEEEDNIFVKFTLQSVDYVITELCMCGEGVIHQRILTILGQRGETLETVKGVMEDS